MAHLPINRATFHFPSCLAGGILSLMEPTIGHGAEELLHTYTEDGGINYLAAAATLPSRSFIYDACAELMTLMFPGFRVEPPADSSVLPLVSRSRLRRLQSRLKPKLCKTLGKLTYATGGDQGAEQLPS